MRNFCTHFNFKYLARALALHESMEAHIVSYHLFMFVFDDLSFEILTLLNLPNVDIIHYRQFEGAELLKLKTERSTREYMWTVTPFIIIYVFDNYGVQECTYIDADIYFFSTPEPVFTEAGLYNAIITEHRYAQRYDQASLSGRFCVQFNSFMRWESSQTVLHDWKNSVAAWCFDRRENGLFGDQMYLDAWPSAYDNIYIVKNAGVGMAPWNALNYSRFRPHKGLTVTYTPTGQEVGVIFFHFHALTIFSSRLADLGNYVITRDIRHNIFRPYLRSLNHAHKQILLLSGNRDIFTPFHWSLKNVLRQFKRIGHKNFNIVRIPR